MTQTHKENDNMTQGIIPGCETNPDPKNVINVKGAMDCEIDPDESDNAQDAFDKLLVSSSNAARHGDRLVKENERLRADSRTLSDLKSCVDSICDEAGIEHDMERLREIVREWRRMTSPQDPEEGCEDFVVECRMILCKRVKCRAKSSEDALRIVEAAWGDEDIDITWDDQKDVDTAVVGHGTKGELIDDKADWYYRENGDKRTGKKWEDVYPDKEVPTK